MRHGHGLRKLNRTTSHRLAMFRNMAVSLLTHEEITTTLPKAKELRRVVEPMITMGKTPTLANRRLAYSRLRDHDTVSKLFADLGPRYAKRKGGYLRILKSGFRGRQRADGTGQPARPAGSHGDCACRREKDREKRSGQGGLGNQHHAGVIKMAR